MEKAPGLTLSWSNTDKATVFTPDLMLIAIEILQIITEKLSFCRLLGYHTQVELGQDVNG